MSFYEKISHAGEKPHQRDQCNKTFVQKATLNNDYRIHNGVTRLGHL